MLASFLIPEAVLRQDGTGPAVEVGPSQGKIVLLTLGITRIIEQESLDVSIWGSADNAEWGSKPLAAFPQKFYCGTYQLMVDLSEHPEVKHLQARWKMNRWGHGESKPLFGVYLFAQESQERAIGRSAG